MDSVRDASGFAAILAGYYLLLSGIPYRDVMATLFRFISIQFPCTWCDTMSKQSCRVGDCLLGLSFAMERDWLKVAAYDAPVCVDLVTKFDTSWVIPGKLMVLGDPMATIFDPAMSNKITLQPKPPQAAKELKPSKLLERRQGGGLRVTIPTVRAIQNTNVDTTDPSGVMSPLSPLRSTSKSKAPRNVRSLSSTTPCDFATFFKQNNVQLLVRCNYCSEEGLAAGGGSYSAREFESFSKQLDIPFPDFEGGLPTNTIVRQFLDAERSTEGCVAIHCKSGFGRSVTLAAVLLMCRHNFSVSAALGWVRLCRGGAFTTPLQEEYLHHISRKNTLFDFSEAKQSSCCVIS